MVPLGGGDFVNLQLALESNEALVGCLSRLLPFAPKPFSGLTWLAGKWRELEVLFEARALAKL